MHTHRRTLALALGLAAVANLDDRELGPEGIVHKHRPRNAQEPVRYRGSPVKPSRPPSMHNKLSRSDEDVIERMAKQLAKNERRARAAGIEYKPQLPEGFTWSPESQQIIIEQLSEGGEFDSLEAQRAALANKDQQP